MNKEDYSAIEECIKECNENYVGGNGLSSNPTAHKAYEQLEKIKETIKNFEDYVGNNMLYSEFQTVTHMRNSLYTLRKEYRKLYENYENLLFIGIKNGK